MDVIVNMASAQPFVLEAAVLVYRERGGGKAYASVHDVEVKRQGARPKIGAGKPATRGFVRGLISGLGQSLGLEFIPDSLLFRTHDLLVWWTPAQRRTLFFSGALKELDAEEFPIPPLVWRLNDAGELYVRALGENLRPTPESALYVAPFWNTNPTTGRVCQGTMARPDAVGVTSLGGWVDGYFRAQFTHQDGPGDLTSFKGGHSALWRSLAGKKKPFPLSALLFSPYDRTLADFAAAGGSDD
jgi:PRTRC genetic system protein B